jgi:hypothetical protein
MQVHIFDYQNDTGHLEQLRWTPPAGIYNNKYSCNFVLALRGSPITRGLT